MDAGVPIAEHVGAISVGLVMDEDEDGNVTRHALLSDIMGLEDVLGDMDFKIAGTRGGITGIQARSYYYTGSHTTPSAW